MKSLSRLLSYLNSLDLFIDFQNLETLLYLMDSPSVVEGNVNLCLSFKDTYITVQILRVHQESESLIREYIVISDTCTSLTAFLV